MQILEAALSEMSVSSWVRLFSRAVGTVPLMAPTTHIKTTRRGYQGKTAEQGPKVA